MKDITLFGRRVSGGRTMGEGADIACKAVIDKFKACRERNPTNPTACAEDADNVRGGGRGEGKLRRGRNSLGEAEVVEWRERSEGVRGEEGKGVGGEETSRESSRRGGQRSGRGGDRPRKVQWKKEKGEARWGGGRRGYWAHVADWICFPSCGGRLGEVHGSQGK
eukprot:605368-Hanusia_phi.AAC.1